MTIVNESWRVWPGIGLGLCLIERRQNIRSRTASPGHRSHPLALCCSLLVEGRGMPLYRYAVSESASDSTTSSSENEPFSDDEQTGSASFHHAAQPAAPSTSGTSRVRAVPRLGHSQLYTHYIPPTISHEKPPVRSRKILRLRAAILDGLLALLGLLDELNEDDATGGQGVRPATRRPRRTRKGHGVHLRLGGGNKQESHEPWSACATALQNLCLIIRSQGRVLDDQPSRICLSGHHLIHQGHIQS